MRRPLIHAYPIRRGWFGRRHYAPVPVWYPGNLLRHMPGPVFTLMSRYHRRNAVYLFGYLRLAGWAVFGGSLAFIDPRLVPLGVLVFELGVYIAGRRSYQPEEEWGQAPPDDDAGDREPRHPYPSAGAGSVALPLEP